jgi:nitroimidazol reductase NimA-like FMN-containing flavoprotein (pyridoxamine 5'-phosphate oxidase superfamily)
MVPQRRRSARPGAPSAVAVQSTNLEVLVLVQEMTPEQCREELTRAAFGRLACARDNQPYVVPVYFTIEGQYAYSFSMLGQKIGWLRTNPLVCLEVDSVKTQDDWTTVLVFGKYEELLDSEERQRSHQLLQQRAMWWLPGAAVVAGGDGPGDSTAVFFRISMERMTGHRAVPGT